MSKYDSLLNVLDQIRYEAPTKFSKYRPAVDDLEKINQSRSRALIHLFLKVSFGILDFEAREKLIADKSYDAGIDAYFIDNANFKIYFIQSKFRTNEENFENKEISVKEILNMDIDRVIDGETKDEEGNNYNGKILQIQRELSDISDIGRYSYNVIILANLRNYKTSDIRKLTGGFPAEVFDNKKMYKELLFPVVTGTYYGKNLLSITLNLHNKNSPSSRVSYNVKTEYSECDITVVFVPTKEIGRILHMYKNSILKFNPRCFLEMSANSVNKDIYSTIIDKETNEFALFNNGITMLSDVTDFNERIGQKDKAQVLISNPQIINGGQTAFTLSRVYQDIADGHIDETIFDGKEVLLKIITFGEQVETDIHKKRMLIESISKATNSQSEVTEADRRSNDKIQVDLQELIFDRYGYYYERKKGEFADGLKDKYMLRDQIIDRELLLRLAIACDEQPSLARTSSTKTLFKESNFTRFLNNIDRVDEYMYAYNTYKILNSLEKSTKRDKNDVYGISAYGQALRYGKFAVVTACTKKYFKDSKSHKDLNSVLGTILSKWIEFEKYVQIKAINNKYFSSYVDEETGVIKQDLNYAGYYKGNTINKDISVFFKENIS